MATYHHRRYQIRIEKRSLWETFKRFCYYGSWQPEVTHIDEVLPGTPEYDTAELEETFVMAPYTGKVAWINPIPFIPNHEPLPLRPTFPDRPATGDHRSLGSPPSLVHPSLKNDS